MLAPLLAAALVLGTGPARPDAAAALAAEIEHGMSRGEDALTPNLDFDALIDRTVAGLDLPRDFKEGFADGASRSKGLLASQIVEGVKGGGSFRLLRMHDVDGRRRALFRFILPNSGVNYFDAIFTSPGRGPVRVADVWVAGAGELLSQSFRRLVVMAAAEAKLGLLDRLAGRERLLLQNMPKLKGMNQALQARRFEEVMTTFESLPPELRRERAFLRVKIVAASNLGEERYLAAIEEFLGVHPEGADSVLMAIDGYFLRKQYPQALEALDRLDQQIGGDPYIDVLRAATHLTAGDRPAARAAYQRAVEREPTRAEPYWSLVTMALEDRDHAAVVRWLDAVERDAGVGLKSPEELSASYAGFLSSKEGKAWARRRRAR